MPGSLGTEYLLELMERVSVYMRSPSVEAWADLEITKPQLRALLLLRRGPVRMTVLAAELGTSTPAATSLVDRLVAKGIVSRIPDPQDRRVVLCRLSPFGQEQIERLWGAGHQHLQALVGCLTADELATVTQGLEVLATAVQRQAAQQATATDGRAGVV